MRPLIGITSYDEPVAWGAWNVDAVLVPTAYVRAVEQAGGRALVIPAVVAITKCDKLAPARRTERAAELAQSFDLAPERVVATSARTGTGVAALWRAIEAASGR